MSNQHNAINYAVQHRIEAKVVSGFPLLAWLLLPLAFFTLSVRAIGAQTDRCIEVTENGEPQQSAPAGQSPSARSLACSSPSPLVTGPVNSETVNRWDERLSNPSNIYFPPGTASLSPQAQRSIDDVAERLKASNLWSVTLLGYADDSGSNEYEVALAQSRMEMVADSLKKSGVSPRQIRFRALIVPAIEIQKCISESCRVSYRRVEVQFVKRDEHSENQSRITQRNTPVSKMP